MRAVRSLAIFTLLLVAGVLGAMPLGAETPAPKPAVFPLSAAALSESGLEVVWQTEVLTPPDPVLSNLWLSGRFVVGRSADSRVFVIGGSSGVRLWSRQMAEPFQKVWEPAVYKDELWLATTTKLLGFKGFDGAPIASIDLGFAPAGKPVTNGTLCFIPDSKGWLQAVSMVPRTVSWGRWTEDAVTAGPVLDTTCVYFACQDGTVFASTQGIRHVQWEYKTEGAVVADLQKTKSGMIIVGSLDYTLYAFAGPSGRIAWRHNVGEAIRKTPYAVGNAVFLFTKEAGLTAIDGTNGRAKWTLPEGADFLASNAQTAYILGRNGQLIAVNRADGKVNFSVPLAAGAITAANQTDNGVIYVGMPSGLIAAIAKKGEVQAKKGEPAEAPKADAPSVKKPAPMEKKPAGADTKKPEGAGEAKPAEAKPAEAKPAEGVPAEAKPAEAKPAEAAPAAK